MKRWFIKQSVKHQENMKSYHILKQKLFKLQCTDRKCFLLHCTMTTMFLDYKVKSTAANLPSVDSPSLRVSRSSPGSAFRRQEVKKSAVKWMSTSQKKSRTFLLCLQALAPTSRPRPRENSSFIWIRVKLLNRVSL